MYGVKLSSVVAARASSSQPAYFDRVIAFVSIDVSPSRPLSSHWWTSRTRALLPYLICSCFLSIHRKKSLFMGSVPRHVA